MSQKKVLNVDDAYALETPEDNVRLYSEWADSYDSDFVENAGYIFFRHVAECFAALQDRVDGPVLDVGCGTGVVGVCLREHGIATIDGIDISTEMLDHARQKKAADGTPVYRNLIQADLTRTLDLPDNRYGALISSGTFTHGHLGPEALDELWRVAAPGAPSVIGVRTTHYESMGFAGKLAADVESGTISEPKLVEVDLYTPDTPVREHAGDKGYVVICQVLKAS